MTHICIILTDVMTAATIRRLFGRNRSNVAALEAHRHRPGTATVSTASGTLVVKTPNMSDLTNHDLLLLTTQPAGGVTLPLRERIADRLADLLWISDDIMEMIAAAPDGDAFAECNRSVRAIYDTAGVLVKKFCD